MDFKVKCVGYVEPVNERGFTIGKVYDVVNGTIIRDDGFKYSTWSDPSCNLKYENTFKGLCEWFKNWYKFELVTESKYKVGDKVKVRSDLEKFKAYDGMHVLLEMYEYRGKTVTIDRVEQGGKYYGIKGYRNTFWTNDMFEGLAVEQNKIVITHDGKTTTATLYREGGSKEVATAKCCPEDTFDFNVGAKLAMERLMKKVEPVGEWRVVNRKPRPGDYIRITNPEYFFDTKGDILRIDGIHRSIDLPYIYQRNHPNATNTQRPDFDWSYPERMFEVVEKVTVTEPKKPEPPKYFTGKVVCIENSLNDGEFTIGKIYEIKDGNFTDNFGKIRPKTGGRDRVKTLSDLENEYYRGWYYKFIPIVE